MKICLTLIVKNEAHVMERCFECNFPYVTSWCIVDTGSTDGTQELIQRLADKAGKPGKLYERPWVNFGHNRSEALQLARDMDPKPDWLFMTDADDITNGPKGKKFPILMPNDPKAPPGYNIEIRQGTLMYGRPQIFSAHKKWIYKGALHEYATLDDSEVASPYGTIPNDIWIESRREGGRNKNPKKYEDDAKLLADENEKEPNNPRTVFYLAQSYRDAGMVEDSKKWYLHRYNLGGWKEEQYISLLSLIRMENDMKLVTDYGWKAIELAPERKEATTAVLNKAREQSVYTQELFALGHFTDTYSYPAPKSDFLFVEADAYDWRFHDEFSLMAFYTGHKLIAKMIIPGLLKRVPANEKSRILSNIDLTK
jgi:glycosyltransferase involved in cell wall biosynthesis